MNLLRTLFLTTFVATTSFVSAQDGEPSIIRVTHGPILGRPGPDTMSIWVRTNEAGPVTIFYGTDPDNLDRVAPPLTLSLVHI